MERARIRERQVAKDREDALEISEAYSAPRRIVNQIKYVMKNLPAKIDGDTGAAQAMQMNPLQCFATQDEDRTQKNQQKRKAERDARARALPNGDRQNPQRTS